MGWNFTWAMFGLLFIDPSWDYCSLIKFFFYCSRLWNILSSSDIILTSFRKHNVIMALSRGTKWRWLNVSIYNRTKVIANNVILTYTLSLTLTYDILTQNFVRLIIKLLYINIVYINWQCPVNLCKIKNWKLYPFWWKQKKRHNQTSITS